MRRLDGTENGYILEDNSTNEDFKEICAEYGTVKCIICNSKTARRFRPTLFGNGITVNNILENDVIYINQIK